MNSKNIEKRYDLIRMLLAIALAMGLVLLLIVLVSSKPLEAMGYFLTGPLKNTRRFFNVIEAAIPLVFTGLAVSMLFSANMSNMSTEGAFYMACAASSYCAVVLHLPAFWHVVVCLLVGTVTGAIIASIPGVLRVKWEANELVSSLMQNYVCLYMANYIIRVKKKQCFCPLCGHERQRNDFDFSIAGRSHCGSGRRDGNAGHLFPLPISGSARLWL